MIALKPLSEELQPARTNHRGLLLLLVIFQLLIISCSTPVEHDYARDPVFIEESLDAPLPPGAVKPDSPVNYHNHVFKDRVYYKNCRWNDVTDFSGAHFTRNAIFDSIQFGEDNYFTGARFDDTAVFKRSDFDNACFNYARFDSLAHFDTVHLSLSHCLGGSVDAMLAGVVDGSSYFTGTYFGKGVHFSRSVFEGDVYFNTTFFSDFGGDFAHSKFGRKVSFDQLRFSEWGSLYFYNAVLSDSLFFSNSQQIPREIDLTQANFEDPDHYWSNTDEYARPHYILFYNTDISKFKLDYIHFRLYLPDLFVYPDGRRVRVTDDEKEAVYEAVLANFKAHGQRDSYRSLDIEYRKFKMRRSPVLSNFIWVPELGWNFGYNKELVFFWMICFLLAFTLINFFLLPYLNEEVYPVKNLPSVMSIRECLSSTTSEDIFNRLWASLIYTGNIFFKFAVKTEKVNWQDSVATTYLIVIYLVGLIFVLISGAIITGLIGTL